MNPEIRREFRDECTVEACLNEPCNVLGTQAALAPTTGADALLRRFGSERGVGPGMSTGAL